MRVTPAAEPSATNFNRKCCRINELMDCIALATHTHDFPQVSLSRPRYSLYFSSVLAVGGLDWRQGDGNGPERSVGGEEAAAATRLEALRSQLATAKPPPSWVSCATRDRLKPAVLLSRPSPFSRPSPASRPS